MTSPPNAPRRGATVEQLRAVIDRGETGEKTPSSDPATAPLGTDDEAAGTRHDPDITAQMIETETEKAPPPQLPRLDPMKLLIIAIFIVLCAAFVWFAFTGAPTR